jgi:hypothetical protein
MTSQHRWTLGIFFSGPADILICFGTDFDYSKVISGEAILFLSCALVFALFIRVDRTAPARPRWIQLSLGWLYGLGGLHCFLWITGVPIRIANFVIFAFLLAVILVYAVIRRRSSTRVSSADKSTTDVP